MHNYQCESSVIQSNRLIEILQYHVCNKLLAITISNMWLFPVEFNVTVDVTCV